MPRHARPLRRPGCVGVPNPVNRWTLLFHSLVYLAQTVDHRRVRHMANRVRSYDLATVDASPTEAPRFSTALTNRASPCSRHCGDTALDEPEDTRGLREISGRLDGTYRRGRVVLGPLASSPESSIRSIPEEQFVRNESRTKSATVAFDSHRSQNGTDQHEGAPSGGLRIVPQLEDSQATIGTAAGTRQGLPGTALSEGLDNLLRSLNAPSHETPL